MHVLLPARRGRSWLSPVVDRLTETGHYGEGARSLFGAIDALRTPTGYMAEVFTAGAPKPVREVLARLAAIRSFMRHINLRVSPTCRSRTRSA